MLIYGGVVMNYEDVFNLPLLKKEVEQGKKELEQNLKLYGGMYILETIVPASAGIDIYDKFLEMMGRNIPEDFDKKALSVYSLFIEINSYFSQQLADVLFDDKYAVFIDWVDGDIDLVLIKEGC
jgi:hypothetical protein